MHIKIKEKMQKELKKNIKVNVLFFFSKKKKMISDFLSTSTAQSDDPDPLKMELERVKAKAAKDHSKIRALKKQIADLTLKNQLLTEENKLLQTTRAQPVQTTPKQPEGKTISQTRVSQVLSEFDTLLEQQSKEINELLSDKNRLSSVCFASLSLLNSQEYYITKFKTATQKLLRFVSKGGETLESVAREFKAIGIDVTPDLNVVNRAIQVNSIVSMLNTETSKIVDGKEVEQIIQMLPQTQLNDTAMRVIVQYLVQQINATKEYERNIQSITKTKDETEKMLSKLMNKLKPNNTRRFTVTDALHEIENLVERESRCKSLEQMISSLVETFAQFGLKFDHDPDIQRCLGRIRFWVQNPQSDVNIVQEIDFLLGMCLTERKINEVYQNQIPVRGPSARPTSQVHQDQQQRPYMRGYGSASGVDFSSDYRTSRKHNYHNDLLQQVKDMKTTVSDMKDRLSEANRDKQIYPY